MVGRKMYIIDDQQLFDAALARLERESRIGFGISSRKRHPMDGIRDPEFPCEAFVYGRPDGSGSCMSDGCYLCIECVELSLESTAHGDDLIGTIAKQHYSKPWVR